MPSALPHQHVYTRLRPSTIHGIGVFAIVDIPEGTYLFEPDDSSTLKVKASEVKILPAPIRELYQDFCVLAGEEFECPANFNQITPSWYLNHSTEPNVAADEDLKFFTIRNIKAGEELTADYETYSENETNLSKG